MLWPAAHCQAGTVDWKGYGTKNVLCSPYNSTVFSQECNVWPAVTNSHFPPVFISLFLLLRRHCHATLLFRRHEMNSAAEDSSSKNRSRVEILIVPETLKNEMRFRLKLRKGRKSSVFWRECFDSAIRPTSSLKKLHLVGSPKQSLSLH